MPKKYHLSMDMPESVHRKLSMLAARTGRKKVDIVRMLLEDGLKEVEG
jgi:predicted DNA-binding protein